MGIGPKLFSDFGIRSLSKSDLLALLISMSRQGLIFIPSLFILQAFIGLKVIIWAQSVAVFYRLWLHQSCSALFLFLLLLFSILLYIHLELLALPCWLGAVLLTSSGWEQGFETEAKQAIQLKFKNYYSFKFIKGK